jgi:glycolate oxidase iron-sulfur subunit
MAARTTPRGFSGPDQPDSDETQRCVRCGLCVPHCPTYVETLRETSSPRGRIHLISAVAAGKLDVLDPGFTATMRQCLDCRACEAVCPSGVQYGQLVEATRAQISRAERATGKPQFSRDTLRGLFGDMRHFRAAVRLLRTYQQAGGRTIARLTGILRLLGLSDAEALLPEVPTRFFIPHGQRYDPAPISAPRPVVAFFAGCVMSTLLAPTDAALLRVLRAAGHPVVIPATQGCCGALATHGGDPDFARELARRNIAAFEDSGAAYIVNNAAGCGSALKDYGHLLAHDPAWSARAAAFSAQVRDASEVLVDDLDILRPQFKPLRQRVTYQEPCHLAHAQRITRQPRDLLRAIPELELVEMAESALCCGGAGIYNLTQPAMAQRLQRRKVANIQQAQADIVVTANPGCYLQVRAGLAQAGSASRTLHLVEVLDISLRSVDQGRE